MTSLEKNGKVGLKWFRIGLFQESIDRIPYFTLTPISFFPRICNEI